MKKHVLAVMVILALGITTNVWGTTITGFITETSGLYATSKWQDDSGVDARLSWSITDTSGHWRYTYNFTVDEKAISHIIIQVSNTFTESDILSGTTTGFQLGTWGTQGNSNPGIPSPGLYGLKWSSLANSPYMVIVTIVTDRAPMQGNFYSKDGTSGGADVYAYSGTATGFGNNVPVPDTAAAPVPEPATMLLLGSGLIGLAGFARKKFKR